VNRIDVEVSDWPTFTVESENVISPQNAFLVTSEFSLLPLIPQSLVDKKLFSGRARGFNVKKADTLTGNCANLPPSH